MSRRDASLTPNKRTVPEHHFKTEKLKGQLSSNESVIAQPSHTEENIRKPRSSDGGLLEQQLYQNARPRNEATSHHARLGEYTASLWKQKNMTDVNVRVDDKTFPTHKAVLSCYSPHFKRIFSTSGLSQKYLINLSDVTAEAFKVLLQYMYTGKLKLTCQNIGDIYNASRKLEMVDARNRCAEILKGEVRSPENALYIYVTCKNLNLEKPAKRILNVILENFEEIVVKAEFMQLDIEHLVEILSSDIIGARSEIVLYLAALKWLHYSKKEREIHAIRLLGCIRFPLMNMEEILVSYYPPLLPKIAEVAEIRQMLLQGTCFIGSKMAGLDGCFEMYSARPRQFLVEKEPFVLWDIRKYDASHLSPSELDAAAKRIQKSFRRYLSCKRDHVSREDDRRLNEAARRIQACWRGHAARKDLHSWKDDSAVTPGITSLLDSLTTDPCLHVLLYHKKIYERPELLQRHPGQNKHFPTKHLRKVAGSIQLPDSEVLLITGGINPFRPEDSVDAGTMMLRFDRRSNGWKRCGKMPCIRHHHCVAYHRGNVYVIGGCDPRITFRNRLIATPTCYRFNLRRKEWKKMSDMHNARIYHGVAVLHDLIYVIGGKNESGRVLSSVECYTPELDQWLELERTLCCPRMAMGVAAYKDVIWVVGGMVQPKKADRVYLIGDVDCYDPHTNKWTFCKSQIPLPKCFLTLVQSGNLLYSIGGAVRNHSQENVLYLCSVTDVLSYDVVSNQWANEEPLPSVRHNVAAASLGNDLFCLGGLSHEEMAPLSDVVVRRSEIKSWDQLSPLPLAVVGCAAIALPKAEDVT